MAGHAPEPEFTGIQKTFNTITYRGRLNCAYASMAFWGGLFLLYKLKPSKKVKEIKQ